MTQWLKYSNHINLEGKLSRETDNSYFHLLSYFKKLIYKNFPYYNYRELYILDRNVAGSGWWKFSTGKCRPMTTSCSLTSTCSFMREASLWTNSTALSLPHTWTSLAGTPTKSLHHRRSLCAIMHHSTDQWVPLSMPRPYSDPQSSESHLSQRHHLHKITWPSHDHHSRQPYMYLHEWSTPMFGTISTVHERCGASWLPSWLANCISSPVCRSQGMP